MDPALGDQEPEAQRILLSRGRNMFHISVDCLFQNGSKKKTGTNECFTVCLFRMLQSWPVHMVYITDGKRIKVDGKSVIK